MTKKIRWLVYSLILAILFTCLAFTPKASGKVEEEVKVEQPKTVIEIIGEIAPRFGQDPKLIEKITWCESHHEVKSHDGGRGTNVTGIHDKTFDGWLPLYEKEQGETLDKASTYDQIKMMAWAFSKGDGYRNQWTSYVAYTNGGIYSFYSKLLKAHFTVKCK